MRNGSCSKHRICIRAANAGRSQQNQKEKRGGEEQQEELARSHDIHWKETGGVFIFPCSHHITALPFGSLFLLSLLVTIKLYSPFFEIAIADAERAIVSRNCIDLLERAKQSDKAGFLIRLFSHTDTLLLLLFCIQTQLHTWLVHIQHFQSQNKRNLCLLSMPQFTSHHSTTLPD